MKEHDISKKPVYDLRKDGKWEYELIESARFTPPYSTGERDALAGIYAEYAGGTLYNSPIVCLENVSPKEDNKRLVSLSLLEFYDFVLCNIIGREMAAKDGRLERYLRAAGIGDTIFELAITLGENFKSEQKRINSFESCVGSDKLPNAIASSVLVNDGYGNYLLSRRTDKVIIGKSLYGVTATGSVEPGDIAAASRAGNNANPFAECGARELLEETGLDISSHHFALRGFAIGKSKLQPIAILDAVYPGDLGEDFRLDGPLGNDDDEVRKVVSVKQDRLGAMPGKYDMTEAAAYHINIHA